MDNQLLKRPNSIKRENLNPYQFTVSILNEGFKLGVFSENEIDGFQAQIALIMKDLIMQYTRGESTSVTVDTAEKIVSSILYSVDAYISSFSSVDESINIMKTGNVRDIYERGIEIVASWIDEAKRLYRYIRKYKLNVPLEAYNLTIDEAIPAFFRGYDVVFETHYTMASIDYPLVFDDMRVRGILYIKNYLEHLKIENEVCSHFDNGDILKTLKGYGKLYKIEYKTSLINIFEIVLGNSIFSAISGNSGDKLIISKSQYEIIKNKFESLNPRGIELVVDEAVERVINDLGLKQIELLEYIRRYKKVFLPGVLNAVKNGSLQNAVVIENEQDNKLSVVTFEDGESMDSGSFRLLIGKIMRCRDTKGKISLIKSNVHSLQDFIDVLDADCLFEDEFAALFNSLSEAELSVLCRNVFYEVLRDGSVDLSAIDPDKFETEAAWQAQYVKYIQGIDRDSMQSIEGYINTWHSN